MVLLVELVLVGGSFSSKIFWAFALVKIMEYGLNNALAGIAIGPSDFDILPEDVDGLYPLAAVIALVMVAFLLGVIPWNPPQGCLIQIGSQSL